MRNSIKKPASKKVKVATTFGVALASGFVAVEIYADIQDMTFNNGAAEINIGAYTITTQNGYGGYNINPTLVRIDQIDGTSLQQHMSVRNLMYTWYCDPQYVNGMFYTETARRFFGAGTTYYGGNKGTEPVQRMARINPGQVASINGINNFTAVFGENHALSGYVAFRTSNNNFGWFKIEFKEPGSPIKITGGKISTEGEPLVVGGGLPNDLGDLDGNGIVDLLDVGPFVDALTGGQYDYRADINFNGLIDLLDVAPFVELLTN